MKNLMFYNNRSIGFGQTDVSRRREMIAFCESSITLLSLRLAPDRSVVCLTEDQTWIARRRYEGKNGYRTFAVVAIGRYY